MNELTMREIRREWAEETAMNIALRGMDELQAIFEGGNTMLRAYADASDIWLVEVALAPL